MSRTLALAAAAAFVAAAAPASADTAFFRWPGKPVGCAINHHFVRCDTSQGSPVALVVHAAGVSGYFHTHGTLFSLHEPLLGYGHSIRRGHLRCRSTRAKLTCHNGSGHGFTVSAATTGLF